MELAKVVAMYCVCDAAMVEAYEDLSTVNRKIKRSCDRYNTLTSMDAPRQVLVLEWANLKNLRETAENLSAQARNYSNLRSLFKQQAENAGITVYTPTADAEKAILSFISAKGYDMAKAVRDVYQNGIGAYRDLVDTYRQLELNPVAAAV